MRDRAGGGGRGGGGGGSVCGRKSDEGERERERKRSKLFILAENQFCKRSFQNYRFFGAYYYSPFMQPVVVG